MFNFFFSGTYRGKKNSLTSDSSSEENKTNQTKKPAEIIKQKRVAWFLGLDRVDDFSDTNLLVENQNQKNYNPFSETREQTVELKDINYKLAKTQVFSGLPTVPLQDNKCQTKSTEIDV
jgi:hypothetical protein